MDGLYLTSAVRNADAVCGAERGDHPVRGTRREHAREWTEAEEAILRRGYRGRLRKGFVRDLAAKLPGRTFYAIVSRAQKLGLQRRAEWSAREDHVLRLEWGELGKRSLLARFPGRTWNAIVRRASDLRLGSPARGRVSVAEAARVCGYAFQTMWHLLARHGVTMRLHPGGRRGSVQRRYLVDLDDAREAVARDIAQAAQTETIAEAARRHRTSRGRMAERLRAARIATTRGLPSRLDPRAVDAAVAAWRAAHPMSVRCSDAARRRSEARTAA